MACGPGVATSGARGRRGSSGQTRRGQVCGGRKETGARGRRESAQAGRRGGEGDAAPTLPHAAPGARRRPGTSGAPAGAARGQPRPRAGSCQALRRGAPSRPRARRGLTPPAPRPRPRPAVARSAGPGEPGEGSPAGRPCGRPGYLGGCWWLGSFPGGRGASGRGRGGRAQRERGGRGRPGPGQAAGRPGSCRRAGGSGGGSGDCSRGSLRVFLGLAQDGGAPCTGFPVTLAMGRTTKEGGRRMRAQLAEPGRGCGARPVATPLPQSSLWTRRDAAEPAPLVLAPEGAEESTRAQAQSRVLPAPGSYCAGSRGTCGTSGSCRSRNVALGTFYYSYCHLMDACRTPATMLSTHLRHSFIMHVLSDSYLTVNMLGPYPTAPEGAYHRFTDGKTEAQTEQVACPRS